MKKRLLSWWADIRSGDLNPVMVRELRQYTRSRFTSYILVLMLAGLLLISAGFFSSSKGSVGVSGVELSAGAGASMYGAVAGALGFASILLALYTAQRMGNEHRKDKPDLLFATSLAPGTIVRGKLFAGLSMFGLLLSLALPFMTMTYLLRGIDVRTILWGLLWLLVLNVLFLTGAILLGCMPLGPLFRRGGIGLFGIAFWFLMSAGPLRGVGRLFGPGGISMLAFDKTVTVIVVSVLVTVFLLPYAMSVLCLSPRWSNRARPFRLTVTVLWALWVGLILVGAFVHGSIPSEPLMACLIPTTLILFGMLQIGECVANTPSTRVLKTVPRFWLGRVLCFPFYAGGAGSLVWCVTLLAGLYGAAYYALDPASSWSSNGAGPWLVVAVYAVCYILTASLLSRRFPKNAREGAGAPWLVSLYLFAASGMVPLFVEMLHETRKIKWNLGMELGSAFAMFHGQEKLWRSHMAFAVPWLVLVLGLNLPRVLTAFALFRRPEEGAQASEPEVEKGEGTVQP
ncbi:MAG: hypothetical protein HN849_28680 [Victivallales bacterium]|nr:hypothetical protein [Victivallales bacterium]